MKKLLLPIVVAAILLTTSCSKDRACVCSYTDAFGQTVTLEAATIKGSKSAAKKACEKNDQEWEEIKGSCSLQ